MILPDGSLEVVTVHRPIEQGQWLSDFMYEAWLLKGSGMEFNTEFTVSILGSEEMAHQHNQAHKIGGLVMPRAVEMVQDAMPLSFTQSMRLRFSGLSIRSYTEPEIGSIDMLVANAVAPEFAFERGAATDAVNRLTRFGHSWSHKRPRVKLAQVYTHINKDELNELGERMPLFMIATPGKVADTTIALPQTS